MSAEPKGGPLPRCATCGRTKSTAGRRPTYTPELLAKLAQLIAGGALARDAARLCGISEAALYEWRKLGELGKRCPACGLPIRREIVEFAAAIEKAKAQRRVLLLSKIEKASREPKHWTAAAWILERTEGADFAPRVTQYVRTELEGALDRIEQEFADEPQILERVLRCLAGGPRSEAARGPRGGDAGSGGGAGGVAGSAPAEPEPSAVPRE